jgi:uncharacterized membrane protein
MIIRDYGNEVKKIKRKIIVAMIKALVIGLIVPILVIALSMMAALLFKEFHIFVRATFMVLFGLAGLGLGTFITLKILERVRLSLYTEDKRN